MYYLFLESIEVSIILVAKERSSWWKAKGVPVSLPSTTIVKSAVCREEIGACRLGLNRRQDEEAPTRGLSAGEQQGRWWRQKRSRWRRRKEKGSVGDMSEEQVERLERVKAERRAPLIVEGGARVSRSEGGETDLKLSV
ncbi:hypothetical protein LXL04_038030 [Taraxacum kok-saghyz]